MGNSQKTSEVKENKNDPMIDLINNYYVKHLEKIIFIQDNWRNYKFKLHFIEHTKQKLDEIYKEFKKNRLIDEYFQNALSENILNIENSLEDKFKIDDFEEYFNKNFRHCKYLSKEIIVKVPIEKKFNSFDESVTTETSLYKGTLNVYKLFHGRGTLITTDGTKFDAFFVNGKINGPCRFIKTEGDVFKGMYQDGKANGEGIYRYSNGTYYSGSWKDDLPHGYGEELLRDGSQYNGNFFEGKKEGYGQFIWNDGSYYQGYIVAGKLQGKGSFHWSDGRFFNGDWLQNQIHGVGVMNYPDGSVYTGAFKNNKKDGKGKYTWNANKYYDGYWKENQQHGEGIYYKDGEIVQGVWENGKILKNNKNNKDS